ncbi:peptidase S8 [Halalkalibacillus sediminis]|uniref:Peptidase S8 n=1 Tax=Halalkalibacillus sediminis TaxID=2018042 RepID=A0A2I0QTT7_9BACI|nr:S8 family serine peptidase [Halalkalibacillus sediminis]PKR77736.1 peptidase S8 [Halalkalibacillus sediminis]
MKKHFLSYTVLIASMIIALFIVSGNHGVNAGNNVHIDPKLEEALEKDLNVYEVIVSYRQTDPLSDQQVDALHSIGIETGLVMDSLPMAGVLATKSQIDELSNQDDVLSIYLNEELEYFNEESNDITGVEKLRTDSELQKENGGFPFTGEGIGVVVNDSGVDGLHKDIEYPDHLVQNVMASTNLNALDPELLPVTYTEDVANTDSNSGHGTHVAGTVGGTGAQSGGKYEGVAPGADLIGYGSGAALFVLDGIGGFDYAIANQSQYDIRVITNSWGSSGDFDPHHPINIASKAAYDRGITVLFAAGNEGPGENTHNPYAKAPWVISVGAGAKDGTLADFSSRGTKGVGGEFDLDGETWNWVDEPTVVAPGVDIISTKTESPLNALSAEKDLEMIDTAHLPYYTTMSGTSMATPHVAGITALLLEADPSLSPDEIKAILQETATNMPGYESWEVGAGYVNAYAAIDSVVFGKEYGSTLNMNQEFNSSVDTTNTRDKFTVDYNPLTFTSDNNHTFDVESGVSSLTARIDGKGILEETGNPVNLVLVDPDGEEHSSGVSLLFPLYTDRVVQISDPMPGTWELKVVGLKGDEINPIGVGLPEEVEGTLSFKSVTGYSGLDDIEGNEAEEAIKMAVSNRLVDGFHDKRFLPNQKLKREDLARYLVMGAAIRQNLNSVDEVSDVSKELTPYASALVSKGAALKDRAQKFDGVMKLKDGEFKGSDHVTRAELAYSLVQALGLQDKAEEFSGEVTAYYKDERVEVLDQDQIPEALKGHVQLAIDLNILNVQFESTQGEYDLEPTIVAHFEPEKEVTRADYAVGITRHHEAFYQ